MLLFKVTFLPSPPASTSARLAAKSDRRPALDCSCFFTFLALFFIAFNTRFTQNLLIPWNCLFGTNETAKIILVHFCHSKLAEPLPPPTNSSRRGSAFTARRHQTRCQLFCLPPQRTTTDHRKSPPSTPAVGRTGQSKNTHPTALRASSVLIVEFPTSLAFISFSLFSSFDARPAIPVHLLPSIYARGVPNCYTLHQQKWILT